MIRIISVLCVALVVTVSASAQAATPAPGQYDDIIQTFRAVSTAVDQLGRDVGQAQNAADVARAFTKFEKVMKVFKVAMEDLQMKYPDMGAHGSAPPADVNESLAAMQESLGKLPAILKKAEPYAADPAVQEAMDEIRGGE